jgi:hypothetical protein
VSRLKLALEFARGAKYREKENTGTEDEKLEAGGGDVSEKGQVEVETVVEGVSKM